MDNRRDKRQASNFSAEVYTRKGVIAANTENLCGDGVCLTLQSKLPQDAVVGISMFSVDDGIEDPDVEPINVPAKVVWCKSSDEPKIQAGMRFEDLPPKAPGTDY